MFKTTGEVAIHLDKSAGLEFIIINIIIILKGKG